ncbi:Hpt domain-containing protein [Magnetospirillum sulfuroxidans]|nr:Hpt domain-containing protein [Magnetospirillum sulfuroxidans]
MVNNILDRAYLTEMRQWVGDAVFHALSAQASDNLAPALADLTAAWRHSDTAAFQEAAHRLKGAAASIGCAALSMAAHDIIRDPRPAEAISGAEMEAFHHLLQSSLQALHGFSDQPHLTPVPASPQ